MLRLAIGIGISLRLRDVLNIYKEHEPDSESSMRKIGISDFSTKTTNYYNVFYNVVEFYHDIAET